MVQVLGIYYGKGHPNPRIDNPTAKENIRQAIENHTTFHVSNESIGTDPNPGYSKNCIVIWRDYDGGPQIADWCAEGSSFNFANYIRMITYGGFQLLDKPKAYLRLHQAWKKRDIHDEKKQWNIIQAIAGNSNRVALNNETLDGDPAWGKEKEVTLDFFIKDFDPHEGEASFTYPEGYMWPPETDFPEEAVEVGSNMLDIASSTAMYNTGGY